MGCDQASMVCLSAVQAQTGAPGKSGAEPCAGPAWSTGESSSPLCKAQQPGTGAQAGSRWSKLPVQFSPLASLPCVV